MHSDYAMQINTKFVINHKYIQFMFSLLTSRVLLYEEYHDEITMIYKQEPLHQVGRARAKLVTQHSDWYKK